MESFGRRFLETIVFRDFTVLDILIGIGGLILFLVVWRILKRLLRTKRPPIYAQVVRCEACDWQGQVSKHAGRCPKCNAPLGDQKAKPYAKK